jgi:hypothetical protein
VGSVDELMLDTISDDKTKYVNVYLMHKQLENDENLIEENWF